MKTPESRERLADPEPGFFKTRLVRNGPWVGARIFLTPCYCTINGGDDSEEHVWDDTCDRFPTPRLSAEINGRPANMDRVWMFGTDITEKEYNFLMDSAKWDRENDPDSPYVTPDKPVNIHKAKPIGP